MRERLPYGSGGSEDTEPNVGTEVIEFHAAGVRVVNESGPEMTTFQRRHSTLGARRAMRGAIENLAASSDGLEDLCGLFDA
jgi:hypothetical protein